MLQKKNIRLLINTDNEEIMIPKIIHYCWFGRGKMPELAIKCIESWKKYLPDYEIKEWNEDNFNVNIIPYTAEAYRVKKYAFVSDYARFWILYNYGGLYFDTDVEIINPIDDIISNGAFMGCELWLNKDNVPIPSVAPGLGLGVEAGNSFYNEVLLTYKKKHLTTRTGVIGDTVVTIITKLIRRYNPGIDLKNISNVEGITIYPYDYFCPMLAQTGEMMLTENSRSIHHYMATWKKENKAGKIGRLKNRIQYIFNQLYVALFVKVDNKSK